METKKNVSFALIALLALGAANYSLCADESERKETRAEAPQPSKERTAFQYPAHSMLQAKYDHVCEHFSNFKKTFAKADANLKANQAQLAELKKDLKTENKHAMDNLDHAIKGESATCEQLKLDLQQLHEEIEAVKYEALKANVKLEEKHAEAKAEAGDKDKAKAPKKSTSPDDSSSSWFPSLPGLEDLKNGFVSMTGVPYTALLAVAAFAATSPDVVELPATVVDNVRGATLTGLVHAGITSRFMQVNSWVLMASHMAIGAAADTALSNGLPEDSNESDDDDADVDYVSNASIWAAKSAAAHATAALIKVGYGKVVGA